MHFFKILDTLSWVTMMATLLAMKLASRYAENIIFGKRFILDYVVLGTTIFSVWMFVLYKYTKSYFNGGEKRASAILCQLFSTIILTIFINVYCTYNSGKRNIYYKSAVIESIGSNYKTGSNYATLLIEGRKERFSPSTKEYDLPFK